MSKTRDGYMDNVDYRCAMIRAGTPQLAGVRRRHRRLEFPRRRRFNATTPIMGVPFSAAKTTISRCRRKITDLGSNSDCIVGRLGDQDTKAARVMLRYTPSDILEVNFSADITDQDDTSPYELHEQDRPRCPRTAPHGTTAAGFARPTASRTTSRFVGAGYRHHVCGLQQRRLDGGIETPNLSMQ